MVHQFKARKDLFRRILAPRFAAGRGNLNAGLRPLLRRLGEGMNDPRPWAWVIHNEESNETNA